MAIDKLSGVAFSGIDKVSDVAKASIESLSGVAAGAAASIVTDNLWIWLDPNYVSGTTITDQSGNGRNGALVNGATVTTIGGSNAAFYTDGINDYAQRATTSNPSTNFPFSIETWMYRGTVSQQSAGYAPTVGKPHNSRYRFLDHIMWASDYTYSSVGGALHRYYTNAASGSANTFNNRFQMINNNHTANGAGVTKSTVDTILGTTGNIWTHQVTTFIQNSSGRLGLKAYLNGVKVKDIDGDNVIVVGSPIGTYAASPWYSGGTCSYGFGYRERYTTGDYYTKGYTGAYRLYTDALTDAEVLNNFNASKAEYNY